MLKQLEQQEKELLAQLCAVREAITKEKLRLAEQNFGVRVGSIVKNWEGVEHKVTAVIVQYSGPPWLEGNPKKKNGTFGTARRKIYDNWTLVSA